MSGVVLMGGKGRTTEYVANALAREGLLSAIIIEEPPSKKKMLRYRVKRLGVWKVSGQLMFAVFEKLFLQNEKRISEIEEKHKLKRGLPNGLPIHNVTSANSKECRELLQTLSPQLVLVNGTRIISNRVLTCSGARFINTHVGITPYYRGVHGGYWALAEGNQELFGTTIHYVDPGVDTGSIIIQKTGRPDRQDNFKSYPTLQYGLIIEKLVETIKSLEAGIPVEESKINGPGLSSRQFFQPTLGQYLWRRIKSGVR